MDWADTDKTTLFGILERIAVANEELIALAKEEKTVQDVAELLGPPICPHCHTLNPRVRSEGGDGGMAEFCLVAVCMEEHCGRTFYAFPQGWISFTRQDEAREEMERRGLA